MPIAPGSVIELRATPNVEAPNPQYSWSGAGTVAEFVDANGNVIVNPTGSSVRLRGKNAGAAGITCTYAFSKFPGLYDPRASVSASVNVTVVEVDYIEINAEGAWRGAGESRTDVMAGSRFTCRAIPKPAGSAWPAGMPVWSGLGSGSGPTVVVNFSTAARCAHLVASCGTQSKTGKFRIAGAQVVEYHGETDDSYFKEDGGGVYGKTIKGDAFTYRLVFGAPAIPAANDPGHTSCALGSDPLTSYTFTASFSPLALRWELQCLDYPDGMWLCGLGKRFSVPNSYIGQTKVLFYGSSKESVGRRG
jgi:hypothetical protein